VLGLLGYLPSVLIGAFILFVGYLISNGVRNLIVTVSESGGFQHGPSLAQLTSGLIRAFALLLGLEQLGLDVEVFADMIELAAAALFGSAALAFGIGASDAVRNVIASHYVRKAYRTGQKVRVHGVEGEILEMTQVAVVVETAEGEAWILARHFLEGVARSQVRLYDLRIGRASSSRRRARPGRAHRRAGPRPAPAPHAAGRRRTECTGRASYGDQPSGLADPRKSAGDQSRRSFSGRTGAFTRYERRNTAAG
jgi:hypothetical protein